MRTRFLLCNLWRKERKRCRNFCGFIELSHDCILFGLCFLHFFQFVIAPILIYHLFAGNKLRDFIMLLFKVISAFRLSALILSLWHSKGSIGTWSYQPIRCKRAQWFVCVLIGSVGSWKRYDYSEAKKRGCEVTFFIKQRVNWKKLQSLQILIRP